MRSLYAILGILAIGSASAGLSPDTIRGLPDRMAQVARAIEGRDTGGATPIPVGLEALAPVRNAYDYVTQRLATPMTPAELGFQSSAVSTPDFSAMQRLARVQTPRLNSSPMLGPSVSAQVRQFDNRMQDLRTYGANPAGWRGPPPR